MSANQWIYIHVYIYIESITHTYIILLIHINIAHFFRYVEASCGSIYVDHGVGFQVSKGGKNPGKVHHRLLMSDHSGQFPTQRAGCTVTSVGNRAVVVGGYCAPKQQVFGDAWVLKIKGGKKKK
jgi:hypothetical protein